jgi:hypothetical protein
VSGVPSCTGKAQGLGVKIIGVIITGCASLIGAVIVNPALADKCVQDYGKWIDLSTAAFCDVPPGTQPNMYGRKLTQNECRAALAATAAYEINREDVTLLLSTDHEGQRDIVEWVMGREVGDDPRDPAISVFHCSDGKNRALVRVRTGHLVGKGRAIWVQFPERFARSANWLNLPPSAPESGHAAGWVPDDLFVVADDTTQGDLRAMPEGTLVRNESGQVTSVTHR